VDWVWDNRDEMVDLLQRLPDLLGKTGENLALAGDGAVRASALLTGENGDSVGGSLSLGAVGLETIGLELGKAALRFRGTGVQITGAGQELADVGSGLCDGGAELADFAGRKLPKAKRAKKLPKTLSASAKPKAPRSAPSKGKGAAKPKAKTASTEPRTSKPKTSGSQSSKDKDLGLSKPT
jgi:hypothetical protein